MFRPDRIGTPNLYQESTAYDGNDITLLEYDPVGTYFYGVNIINASPVLDWGYSQLYHISTEAMTADRRFGLGQQFTVTKPLKGDTVGIELVGAIQINLPTDSIMIPFLCKMPSAVATVLGGRQIQAPVPIAEPTPQLEGATVTRPRAHYYKTQAIVKATDPSGVYCHGFQIYNKTAFNSTWFALNFGVRQLNDQQNVNYRDTLR